jgi:hypothetical protein
MPDTEGMDIHLEPANRNPDSVKPQGWLIMARYIVNPLNKDEARF